MQNKHFMKIKSSINKEKIDSVVFPSTEYKNVFDYFSDYKESLALALNKIDKYSLIKATSLIEKVIKKKNIIAVCGNGGSLSIANHLLCDFAKSLSINTKLKPRIYSLSSNFELISAIANDISYSKVYTFQARNLLDRDDILLLISSSGRSQNLIDLLKFAKIKKIKVISITGFDGGFLKKYSNISIHIPVNNYGISEDSFQMMMHIIMQYLKQKFLIRRGVKNYIF
jgi:phosphoheptose isomerase